VKLGKPIQDIVTKAVKNLCYYKLWNDTTAVTDRDLWEDLAVRMWDNGFNIEISEIR